MIPTHGRSSILPVNERLVVFLIAGIHFVNILDFVIVLPLGPQFAVSLGVAAHHMGLIAGSYTAAAAISGIVASFFLDRFDRRKVLAVSMVGLILGTAACGLAWDMTSLMAARVFAGAFGGPATSISLAIISDVVPPERRGRAMSMVMGAFSVASIMGVPVALEIAEISSWRAPFFAVAGLGVLVTATGILMLPPLKLHLLRGDAAPTSRELLRQFSRPLPLLAYTGMVAMMFSAFSLIPHIPNYLVFNLGYEGEGWLMRLTAPLGYTPSVLGPLYLFGGLASLLVLQVVGRLTDRFGSSAVSWVGAALVVAVIYVWFIDYRPVLPVLLLFVAYMGSMSVRGLPARTLDTKIPRPQERAGFMSAQSAVQHLSLALAAGLSSLLLAEDPATHELLGIPLLGWIATGFALLLPTCITFAELALRRRDAVVVPVPAGAFVTPPAPPAVLGDEQR